MAFLEVTDISKKFNKTEVLHNISFQLEKNEILSIIGPSGNGKTTFLRCLNFLEKPDSGTIKLDDEIIFDENVKLKEKDIKKLRRHFGLVFQNFNLFPQYTVYQNIKLPLAAKEKKENTYKEDELDKTILELLQKLDLMDKKDNYPCQLSGGQQQRVAIARAMALKPDVLCFDEPTSALDPELVDEVVKIIKELKSKNNLTILIVTHDMSFARQISDKVLFMSGGKVAEFGTIEEVFNNPQNEKTQNFIKKQRGDNEDANG